MKKPNILWICTDQQRFDSLGCYGNGYVQTPNIDQLARRGVLFDKAFCQSPICTPSRTSFSTGRYPRTTTCRQNGQSIPEKELVVSKMFHDAGYACGLSGKLHLTACHPSVCKTTERRIDDGYDMFHWSHDANSNWPTNEYLHWLQEKGVAYEAKAFPDSKYIQIGMPERYHQTTWCVEKAINFIESCSQFEVPWFYTINIFDPHAPFDPPEKYLNKYLEQGIDGIPSANFVQGELDQKPYFQQLEYKEGTNSGSMKIKYNAADMTGMDQKLIRAAYWAMVELIDAQVGRLMSVLEASGVLENTLVIFMSDHGELLGDHGMYYKGPFFYEPAIRVPLILSWPSVILSNQKSDALVELVDLVPTLLDAAGIEYPQGIQGRSLWGILMGQSEINRHREDVYCEFYNALPWNKPAAYGTMVRTDRYKLVAYHGLELGELYDLAQDPMETHNLWAIKDFIEVKTNMLQRLCDRMAWTMDPLPVREAAW